MNSKSCTDSSPLNRRLTRLRPRRVRILQLFPDGSNEIPCSAERDGRNHTYSYLRVNANSIGYSLGKHGERIVEITRRNHHHYRGCFAHRKHRSRRFHDVLVDEDGNTRGSTISIPRRPRRILPSLLSDLEHERTHNPRIQSTSPKTLRISQQQGVSVFIESATWKYNMTQYALYTGVNASLYTGDEWAGGLDTDDAVAKAPQRCA